MPLPPVGQDCQKSVSPASPVNVSGWTSSRAQAWAAPTPLDFGTQLICSSDACQIGL